MLNSLCLLRLGIVEDKVRGFSLLNHRRNLYRDAGIEIQYKSMSAHNPVIGYDNYYLVYLIPIQGHQEFSSYTIIVRANTW